MRVTEISYERLVNTGNYQNEKFILKGVINEGENVLEAFKELEHEMAKIVEQSRKEE